MSKQGNDIRLSKLREETYRVWLNQSPIQFPLRSKSPIQNIYSNTSFSHVGDKSNNMEVGMDDFLWETFHGGNAITCITTKRAIG